MGLLELQSSRTGVSFIISKSPDWNSYVFKDLSSKHTRFQIIVLCESWGNRLTELLLMCRMQMQVSKENGFYQLPTNHDICLNWIRYDHQQAQTTFETFVPPVESYHIGCAIQQSNPTCESFWRHLCSTWNCWFSEPQILVLEEKRQKRCARHHKKKQPPLDWDSVYNEM